RVSRDFFNDCLFGSIPESGHAMYNQGMGHDIDRTPLWGGASPGVHESQSRLWENLVGRSQPFWRHFYPSLRSVFPEPLQGVDEEGFYRAVNRAYPSLIRVEAEIETGQFASLLGWLRKNVHRHGRKFTPNELMERATGQPLTAAPWIAYVQRKFGALYALHAGRY